MPQTKTPKRYLLTDHQGRELGESEGRTKVEAVINLMNMDSERPRIGPSSAEKLIEQRKIHFRVLA